MSAATETKDVCRAFRNTGSCKLGNNCKRDHSVGDPIPPPKRSKFPIFPCPSLKEGAPSCTRGRFCKYFHSEEDKKREIPEPCKSYRIGECKFGSNCPFEHIDVQPEEKSTLDCISWVKDGSCKAYNNKGNCIYVHSADKQGKGFAPGEEPKPRVRKGRKIRRSKPASANTTTSSSEASSPSDATQRRPKRRNNRRAAGGSNNATEGTPSTTTASAPAAGGDGNSRPRRQRRRANGATKSDDKASTSTPASTDANAATAAKSKRRPRRARGNANGGAAAANGDSSAPASSTRARGDDTCHAFRDTGVCERGDQCRYRHGADDTRDIAGLRRAFRNRKINQICFNFKEGKDCPRGENCRYLHDMNAADPTRTN